LKKEILETKTMIYRRKRKEILEKKTMTYRRKKKKFDFAQRLNSIDEERKKICVSILAPV